MGITTELAQHHRYRGLRTNAYGRTITMDWPEHPVLPAFGYVITRADLDELVAARAEKAGAVVWQGVEAMAPLSEAGSPAAGRDPSPLPGGSLLRRAGGAIVRDGARSAFSEVRARYVIVADGSLSASEGRSAPGATGTGHKAWPFAATTVHREAARLTSTRSSTSVTRAAGSCPATAGSSRSGTAA